MSAIETAPQDSVSVIHAPLTHREAKLVAHLISGMSEAQAFKAVGFPAFYHDHPSYFPTIDAIRAEVARLSVELVAKTLELGLVNAVELHEQLTDELRGDYGELYDDAGELKPIKEWPLWARQGGVEVLDEPNLVHSTDGENSSWDVQGRKIKVKMSNRHKSRELVAKLKSVNALVADKTGDLHITIHADITAKLQSAIKRKEAIESARVIEGEVIK